MIRISNHDEGAVRTETPNIDGRRVGWRKSCQVDVVGDPANTDHSGWVANGVANGGQINHSASAAKAGIKLLITKPPNIRLNHRGNRFVSQFERGSNRSRFGDGCQTVKTGARFAAEPSGARLGQIRAPQL